MKIGIDYSLSSPGVCVNTSEGEFRYEDCTFYFLTNTKKYDATFKDGSVRFIGSPHQIYKNEPERYSQIADWVVDIIKSHTREHQIKHEYFYWIWAIRVGKWKLQPAGKDRYRLYDLENDIGEKNDLAKEFPEVVKRCSKYFKIAKQKK